MTSLASHRPYRRFLGAAGAANLGDGIGALAFPWVATLLTRDPAWIAFVAAAGRMPWLLLSIPAGVITDRADRRALIVRADAMRAALAIGVVLLAGTAAPGAGDGGAWPLLALSGIAFLFGAAEVLRDNAAQTALPAIVPAADLERANGTLWSVEQVMGAFVGPPLAGLLIALAVPAPFAAQAVCFAVAALCVALLPPMPGRGAMRSAWAEAVEGFAWMRAHGQALRLAILTGLSNLWWTMGLTVLVLVSQEIWGLTAAGHGVLLTAGAAGGVVGGMVCPWIVRRIGPGAAVILAPAIWPVQLLAGAISDTALLAGAAMFAGMVASVLWNVVTVSWRQRLIPAEILGRVNSIYRCLAWGAMPVGAGLAGLVVAVAEPEFGREAALRLPFWIAAAGAGATSLYVAWRLRLGSSG